MTHQTSGDDLPRKPADSGREPEFLSTLFSTRRYSLRALLERVVNQFAEEHAADSTALTAADTVAKRLALVRETVSYVIAVESLQLSVEDQALLIQGACSELFAYGPLDRLFADTQITTIALEGGNKVSVRYGHGELTPIAPIFEDESHLRRILKRLARDAGVDLLPEQSYLEAGLQVGERRLCLNLLMPPAALSYTADIRLHPAQRVTLDTLVETDFMTAQAAVLLRALAQSPHGLVIVGDTESGKTTLLGALADYLPQANMVLAVERAGELSLPQGMPRLIACAQTGTAIGTAFGQLIPTALQQKAACLLLDEIRADAPESIAPLLLQPDAPRQLWAFRGSADPKRVRSALGMLARRADPAQGDRLAQALYARLPFVVVVRAQRAEGRLRLHSIAEWQPGADPAYPEYTVLVERIEGELRLTGTKPLRTLPLDEHFWQH